MQPIASGLRVSDIPDEGAPSDGSAWRRASPGPLMSEAPDVGVSRASPGAGVVVALVVQVLLTMLGAGLGIATLDPGTADNPAASTFSIIASIWFVVSGIIAAFAGGYIAARMSGRTVPTTGALHGLTTWAFTTLIVLYLLSTAVGSLVGGAFSGVARLVSGAGQTVAQIEQQYHQKVAQAKQAATEAADKAASAISTGALAAFVALVLGAVAGWFGGRSGVVHPVFADGLVPHRRRLS
jgi:hypothetical protein